MFRRPLTWFVICILCLAGAWYCWKLGDRWATGKKTTPVAQSPPAKTSASGATAANEVVRSESTSPLALLLQRPPPALKPDPLAYRLSNTTSTIGQLLHNEHALLLENALLDTTQPVSLAIPSHLRAPGEPESYLVQSRGPIDNAFRAALERAGATWISYIPNNASLVRASASAARQLAADNRVQSVLPYEPYYKLHGALLPAAVKQDPMPEGLGLNLVLFADAADATKAELTRLGVEVVSEERTPFGPLLRVRPPANDWYAAVLVPGVQTVESWRPRVLANDRSRVRLGVSADTLVKTNYLNLTGTNVMVAVVDSGVDQTHPDLNGRVFADFNGWLTDSNGHGTHVAGIIAGSGLQSTNPVNVGGILASNVYGSVENADFRGKAQGAKMFALPLEASDFYLQTRAAQTNALISNNSWYYPGSHSYDIAAASYDAAVRDALPLVTGSQPVQFVFAGGNEGDGGDNGLGGISGTITSPGTAKNVITVGALEQARNITNVVLRNCYATNLNGTNITVCETNLEWAGMTSSDSQVAYFSSRGNVGITVEGDFGRFKPDLVAPGTFVVSTRSAQWNEMAYYNPTNHHFQTLGAQLVEGTNVHSYSAYIPLNAVGLTLTLVDRSANLPIYVWKGTDYSTAPPDFSGINQVSFPQDSPLSPRNTTWTWAVGNPNPTNPNQTNNYTLLRDLITTNDNGNYYEVLSNLNNSISGAPDSATPPHYYRFESGTSMSVGDVSGTLALMQEFFTTRLNRAASPALMKALLINGARGVGGTLYDFQVQNTKNFQGWGLVKLPNSIPGGLTNFVAGQPASMWFADQSPSNALATSQSQTRQLSIRPGTAHNQPLRFTLVWTDPPGNPAASIKLVNDLDLIVTNLDTGDVYFGNNIPAGTTFTDPWDTNLPPNLDVVNNVENIYLAPTLDTNYTVTVRAHTINVNAVTAHPNDTVQDYALVISSGDGQVVDALTVTQQPLVSHDTRRVTYVTNTFDEPKAAGFMLDGQRAGANTPLLGTTNGMTNQWQFFVVTNTTSFTNAAFITFLPTELALPRMGVYENSLTNAARISADIDLYVSADFNLTNLAPATVANAASSRNRGGTEQVILSNAVPGQLYYLGVKSEDQMAAEFSIFGVFSQTGFGDSNGVVSCHNFGPIPDRTPDNVQGRGNSLVVVCPCGLQGNTRRVVVTNVIVHEQLSDVISVVDHEGAEGANKFAVLNNHRSAPFPPLPPGPYGFIYEDNGEGNIAPPPGYDLVSSSGPESLRSFVGEPRVGPWLFTYVDDSLTATGRVVDVGLVVELSDLGTDAPIRLVPGKSWTFDAINVPFDATNLTVCVAGNTVQMQIYVRKDGFPSQTVYDKFALADPPGGCLSLNLFDQPPLTVPARYYLGVYNPSVIPQSIRVFATVNRNVATRVSTVAGSVGPVLIKDDAVTYATFEMTNHLFISEVDVGLLIRHQRVSDLAITLISPKGTRVLLFEDRGMTTPDGLGMGSFSQVNTNLTGYYTNDFDSVLTGLYFPGAIFGGWSVLSNSVAVVPNYEDLSRQNNELVLGGGVVSNALPTRISADYQLSFQVNHAPYLVGMVAWWPLDDDATDIFGGHDGFLCCNTRFAAGEVNSALFGDAVRTSMEVPRCDDLDVGRHAGLSVEGWINPTLLEGPLVMSDGFENAPEIPSPFAAITNVSGWLVETGSVDVLYPGYGFEGLPDSGRHCLDLNGTNAGSISTNFTTQIGTNYVLRFAYTKNPNAPTNPPFVALAAVDLTGQPSIPVQYDQPNTVSNLNWAYTSIVFTASSPITKLQFTSLNPGDFGMYLDTVTVREYIPPDPPAPLVEWIDPANTNGPLPGVQLWFSGVPQSGTPNSPGSLWANLWDTNSQPHFLATGPAAIAFGGWQHIALTYDTNSGVAILYTNGQRAVTANLGSFVPRTSGDLYFGFHPAGPASGACFRGGLDEFSLYERALSDCEVAAIFNAGNRGKYGTNVLTCPVALELTLSNAVTSFTAVYTNGLTWTNGGPRWEINRTNFSDVPPLPDTNAPNLNFTAITLRPLDPNVAVDEFTLAAVVTNRLDGIMRFTEDTNLAAIPIKFAPTPFTVSNFPPTLVFSNDFENATYKTYQTGQVIPGSLNYPAQGRRNWTVTRGPVTVLTNAGLAAVDTNFVALADGAISSELPTIPGHRYELRYTVRGPDAVGWWNGDQDPLSGRAKDLIGGNHGAFINGATNSPDGYVLQPGDHNALYFPGMLDFTNRLATTIELGDPPQLRLDKSMTIEGWIRPQQQTNEGILALLGVSEEAVIEQIFFRGDSRGCRDPYWVALEQAGSDLWHLLFHVEGPNSPTCGLTVESSTFQINADWHHVAVVFEHDVNWANNRPWRTNQVRVYVDGQRDLGLLAEPLESGVIDGFTRENPFADLDPNYSPGVAIGNRSRGDQSQPYRGWLDELTVYERALTGPEIAAIYNAGRSGKSDPSVPSAQSLGEVRVLLDGAEMESGHGDNAEWNTHTVTFTARNTNVVLTLESLLPGTLVDAVTLTEIPSELNYLPEESLAALRGEDAFGTWRLEMWDTRVGATDTVPILVEWRLEFQLPPVNPPTVVTLSHGIPYATTIGARSVQYFVVPVPQWAQFATNVLEYSRNYVSGVPQRVSVLYSPTNFLPAITNVLMLPVTFGTNVLTTNGSPPLITGQSYYLAVTNSFATAVTFSFGVWFDLTQLPNCQPVTNEVALGGIPRYFQFDLATNDPAFQFPGNLSFRLTGAQSNLTMVLSERLPLPDLTYHDYISAQPCTNDEVLLLVTNSTPFPIQASRWYVGVFNSTATNVSFSLEVCYSTNGPVFIPLTNEVPYVADLMNQFVAPPGPPRFFFFDFEVTRPVRALLFELYGLSGDADLVLQRDVPPGQAPYFDSSFRLDTTPEQIVVRRGLDVPDLRGHWYLGVYNNESTNVAYTIRAAVSSNGILVSGLPIVVTNSILGPGARGILLQWNSVEGERYEIEFSPAIFPTTWSVIGTVTATTPCATFVAPFPVGGIGFYRIKQVTQPPEVPLVLKIRVVSGTEVRISWPFEYPDYQLQSAPTVVGPWTDMLLPVRLEGNEFAVYDDIAAGPKFYRLVPIP